MEKLRVYYEDGPESVFVKVKHGLHGFKRVKRGEFLELPRDKAVKHASKLNWKMHADDAKKLNDEEMKFLGIKLEKTDKTVDKTVDKSSATKATDKTVQNDKKGGKV